MNPINKPRGTKDIMPGEIYKWYYVEAAFRKICAAYGYGEMRTPMFEATPLFKRGVGETTDIVQKEMFSVKSGVALKDYAVFMRGLSEEGFANFVSGNGKYREELDAKQRQKLDENDFTLKPEGTSPVVRAFIENKVYADPQPSKIYYVTPCFRHERPQAGRLRQFHQFGIETFGSYEPSADAEVIALAHYFFKELGITGLELRINSIGCPKCKPNYGKTLREFIGDRLEKLCGTCQERYTSNPMRILDCKVESCQEAIKGAPYMLEHLCEECSDHFERTKSYLEVMNVPYTVDPGIVRGLDYYNRTAFEFVSGTIGAQGTVCGGGRYDGLIESVGGPAVPGVGFGMGIERLLLTLESQGIEIPKPDPMDVFIVAMGEPAFVKGMELLCTLRSNGIKAEIDHLKRSTKAQFKFADKVGARYSLIIGDDELEKGEAQLKNMGTGEQKGVAFGEIVGILVD